METLPRVCRPRGARRDEKLNDGQTRLKGIDDIREHMTINRTSPNPQQGPIPEALDALRDGLHRELEAMLGRLRIEVSLAEPYPDHASQD